jgi:hypothetical protein
VRVLSHNIWKSTLMSGAAAACGRTAASVAGVPLSGLTDEEQLAAAASVVPMAAVGRPGERLPLTGARGRASRSTTGRTPCPS